MNPALTAAASQAHSAPADPTVAEAVTALFVPGDRTDRFAKAVASGADIVIIDLEDAVAPEARAGALTAVLAALASAVGGVRALVRVNAPGTPTYDTETAALLDLARNPGHGLLGLMVAKAEDPQMIWELAARTRSLDLDLIPLVESAVGVANALALAQVRGVSRLAFGAIDYAVDINAQGGDRYLDYARSVLVVTSRAAGIGSPLDAPNPQIKDLSQVKTAAQVARGFGFGGKLCIHPQQVAAVQEAFAPTEEELIWARSVAGVEGAAVQVDGAMVDRPVVERARRILARAPR